MPRMTQAEVDAHQARINPPSEGERAGVADGEEGDLQQDILDEIARRGWWAMWSRMDKPTTFEKGTPDFVIFAQFPNAYLIEAKTRNGKRSLDQDRVAARARRLGWTVHVVRTLQQFNEAVARPAQLPDVAQRILDRAHQATGGRDRLLTGNDDWVPGVSLADLELILKQEVRGE